MAGRRLGTVFDAWEYKHDVTLARFIFLSDGCSGPKCRNAAIDSPIHALIGILKDCGEISDRLVGCPKHFNNHILVAKFGI